MSVLIQTTENNRPIVLLYRLIHLEETDESAPALLRALKSKLEEDGLWDITKDKLVALITGNSITQ